MYFRYGFQSFPHLVLIGIHRHAGVMGQVHSEHLISRAWPTVAICMHGSGRYHALPRTMVLFERLQSADALGRRVGKCFFGVGGGNHWLLVRAGR